jgi:hypothetical protein
MTRLFLLLAALTALALGTAGTASAQIFRVVSADTPSVPSYRVPNASNSLKLPSPLDRPPAVPAVRSYSELVELWHRAGAAYGVPWDVLAAINKIESNFGQNMGPSYAGALGWMQFIPSTWLRWGMDADGDGVADPWNPDDAVFAAARYLAAAGAHDDLSRAIFAYNHAQWYVDDVLRLAAVFRKSDSGFADFPFPAASEDVLAAADLEARLVAARRRVTKARQAVPRAERRIERLGWRRIALERRAGNLSGPSSAQVSSSTRLSRPSTPFARRRKPLRCNPRKLPLARLPPVTTSSPWAGARSSSRSPTTTTTTRQRTSPPRRGRRSMRWRTRSSSTRTRRAGAAAASGFAFRSTAGRSTCTATSPTWSRA